MNNTILLPPFDGGLIIRKRKGLKRAILEYGISMIPKKVAILGGSTTSEIRHVLEVFLLNNGFEPSFYESEYNMFYEDSMFENRDLAAFKPDVIYIHTTHVNLTSFPEFEQSTEDVERMISKQLNYFRGIWDSLSQRYGCDILQNNFDYPIDRSLGNLDAYDFRGKTNFINRLNLAFGEEAHLRKGLFLNDINYLSAQVGLNNWFDRSLWYQAKYAVSMTAIPELAFNVSKILLSLWGRSSKCLVLDLDNTCWGGVIGDDGLNGIQIGLETAIAEAYTEFQKYVKELKARGVTLAVCSKNELDNAEEGFTHPDSVLARKDFTAFKANWNPKSINIAEIAKEINIGIDSLVFVDDNPAEREIVQSQTPAVKVPNVGNDIVQFIYHLDKNGYFEPISLSGDDLKRNEYYEQNAERQTEEVKFSSYADFLDSLVMTAEIAPFKPIWLDRITQLTNKTNQFNLTTKRYSNSEIEQISKSTDYIGIYGKLADKFGDNGLIAITIGRIESEVCYLDLWLMSCRVLKRNMEEAMLDDMVLRCKEKGVSRIVGHYITSPKNAMVKNMYPDFGFQLIDEDESGANWSLDITDYQIKNRHIEVS